MNIKFLLGETVYFKLGESGPGMVTGIILRPGWCAYEVTWAEGLNVSTHYEMELTDERPYDTGGAVVNDADPDDAGPGAQEALTKGVEFNNRLVMALAV